MDKPVDMRPERPSTSQFYEPLAAGAYELFTARGYRSTSIRDIGERAGSSYSLVRRHFASKEDLYELVMLQRLRKHVADYPTIIGTHVDGSDPLAAEVGRLYRFFADERDLFRSLIASSAVGDGPVVQLFDESSPLRAVLHHLDTVITAQRGKRPTVEGSALTASAVCGLTLAAALLSDWLFPDGEIPTPQRVTAEVTALILHGASGRPTSKPSTLHRTHAQPPIVVAAGDDPPPPRSRVKSADRRRRSRHEVRKAILDSAHELFTEHGLAGTSTKAIADRARVSESSVFRHFPSKSELYEKAVFEPFLEWSSKYLGEWDVSERTTESLVTQSRSYVTAVYSMLHDHAQLFRAVIASHIFATGIPRRPNPLHGIFIGLEDQVAEIARRNQLAGLDIPVLIRTVFGMAFALAVLDDWTLDDLHAGPTSQTVTEALAAIMIYGALGPPEQAASAPTQP